MIDTAIVAASGCAGALIAKGSCANGAITAAFANMYDKWGRITNKGINLGRRYVPGFKGAQKNLNHFFQNVLRDPARYLFGSNSGQDLVGNILPFGAQMGPHMLSQMATRGVNTRMIDLALRKGQTFWDPANKTIQFILRPTSGKNFSVALNPVTRQITTVIRQSKSLVRSRFESFPRSSLDGILK